MLLYVFWMVLLNPMTWYPETRPTRMPLSTDLRLPGGEATHSIDIRRRA